MLIAPTCIQTWTHTKFLPCPCAKGLPHRECFGIVREDAVIHHPAIKGQTVTAYRLASSLSVSPPFSLSFFLKREDMGQEMCSMVTSIQPAVHLGEYCGTNHSESVLKYCPSHIFCSRLKHPPLETNGTIYVNKLHLNHFKVIVKMDYQLGKTLNCSHKPLSSNFSCVCFYVETWHQKNVEYRKIWKLTQVAQNLPAGCLDEQ